jgi:putative ABC transport system permease protein
MYDATQLSANTFSVLNQKPILGRDFATSDELPGAAPVMILSYHLWERRYGKDPGIIGQTVRINSTPASWGAVDLLTSTSTTVIGVMAPELRFPHFRVDLWLPLVSTSGMLFPRLHDRQSRNFYFAFGRLADGVTLQQARSEMEAIGRHLERTYPSLNRDVVPSVKTFHEFWAGPNAVALYGSLWAAVTFVLLIACANLANLTLAKAIGRSRELAVRMALGAGRWRVVRQSLIESLLLSSAGGLLGVVVASWSVWTYNLVAHDPYAYVGWDYGVDGRILVYLTGLAFLAGLLFGVVPAVRLSRLNISPMLKDGTYGAVGGRHGKRLSTTLVATEMALAVVLLVSAGVMCRSLVTIATADLGVESSNVLTALVGLPRNRYPSAEAQTSVIRQLIALQELPGIESVAVASRLPAAAIFGGVKRGYELSDAVTPPGDRGGRPTTTTVTISDDYFHVLGVTVQHGQAFTDAEEASGGAVAIVNQQFARVSWPGQDPIGKRLRFFRGAVPDSWLTVVGVVSNVVQDDRTGQRFEPIVYRPFQQEPMTTMWVLARTRLPPGSLATVFRREIKGIDADVLVGPGDSGIVSPLDELITNNYRSESVNSALYVVFAAIALLLASVGVYAIVAHATRQRSHEIGIRTALGATASDIVALVFREGMRPVGIGLTVGVVTALVSVPVLKSQLVNVSATDPVALFVASGVLVVSASVGCWIPARRAIRVEPIVVLRNE